MWPVVYESETVRIYTYSLMLLMAFAIGFFGLRARLHRLGYERLPGFPFFVITAIIALTGSHLYWLVLYRGPEHAWRAIFFLESGHVFYGGLIAALLWFLLYCWIRRIDVPNFFACAAPALALSYAIGRLGCLAAGCCWGRVSDVWWTVQYPSREFGAYAQHVRRGDITVLEPFSLPVHPTPVYEALGGLLLFACLDFLQRKRFHPMTVVSTFFFGYGTLRFLNEFFRGDSSRFSSLELSGAQFISLGSGIL